MNPSNRSFGAHMSIAGGYHLAVRAAHDAGMQTVQLFTKSNNQWRAKPLTSDDISLFRAALKETGIRNPVSHASYLINLASPDDTLWQKSIESMIVEVQRAAALGIRDVVLHPGAHMGAGEDAGLTRVAHALDAVCAATESCNVTIDLESTAGQGTCLGHRLRHLSTIREQTKSPRRVAFCLDTCHLFAAGYTMRDPVAYNGLVRDIKATIGLSRVRIWHLNDSCKACGSRVDRHAGIGLGMMGLEPFRFILNDPHFQRVPMILETPKGTENGVDLDIINLNTLRNLINPPAPAPKKRKPRRPPR